MVVPYAYGTVIQSKRAWYIPYAYGTEHKLLDTFKIPFFKNYYYQDFILVDTYYRK